MSKQILKISNSLKRQMTIISKLEENSEVIKYLNALDNYKDTKDILKKTMIDNNVSEFNMSATMRAIINSVEEKTIVRKAYKSLSIKSIKVRS
jgi:hypothetical protein|tara:strand:+ start:202 stop:480 length:279 start_codon:yes stop_codon:yes gene_type:complete